MSKLLIFDKYDNLLTTLSNEGKNTCRFWNAPFEEEINKGEKFEFTVQGDHPDAAYIAPGTQVAFKDRDGEYRIFWIRELDETYEDTLEKTWICEAGFKENNGEAVEDIRAYDTTALDALTRVLQGKRWQPGIVAELGINSANFYMTSVNKSIETIINTWGGELRTRITVEDNKITGRFIDILPRRGTDTGKRWVAGKDILKHRRTIISYPITALYPRGKGVESGDGFGRRIDIADVEWSVANGNPVDKPLGQKWIGDPTALELYGVPNSDGTLRHITDFFDDSEEEEPLNLIQSGWDDLQKRNRPIESYELSVILLEKLTGYEHEKVRLGDTTYAINRKFKPEIVTEQRVVRFKYYIDDPSDESAEVTLGEVIPIFTDKKRLNQIEAKLNDRSGIWDNQSGPVTDTDFPNTIPPVPANFTISSGFKTIMLDWEFEVSSYIAAYEVYASQIPGFSPDASNLIFRGKVGFYNFQAEYDTQWYFRVRAINTHATPSDFTAELSGVTMRAGAADIQPKVITNDLIAENAAIDWAKIANVKVGAAQIGLAVIDSSHIKELKADLITSGILKSITIEGVTIKGGSISTTGNYGNINLSGDLLKVGYTTGRRVEIQGGLATWLPSSGNIWMEQEALALRWGGVNTPTNGLYIAAIRLSEPTANKARMDIEADNVYFLSSLVQTNGYFQANSDGDDDTLLRFSMARSWKFKQSGTDAGTSLVLQSETDAKHFYIQSADGSNIFDFFVQNTGSSFVSNGMVHVVKDAEGLRLTGVNNTYLTFFEGSTRKGYVGVGSTTNDRIMLASDVGDVELYPATFKVLFRGQGEINTSGGVTRWIGNSGGNYFYVNSDGRVDLYMGGSIKHVFNVNGTKTGGSIVVDGFNYGMAPIDSPQVLLEYIDFDIPLSVVGTKVYIDDVFIRTVENFAVFPNNGKIIEKGPNYFVITGEGTADCRIVGERIEYGGVFYSDIDATNENLEVAA